MGAGGFCGYGGYGSGGLAVLYGCFVRLVALPGFGGFLRGWYNIVLLWLYLRFGGGWLCVSGGLGVRVVLWLPRWGAGGW